jgi:uncharacterized protein YkwD
MPLMNATMRRLLTALVTGATIVAMAGAGQAAPATHVRAYDKALLKDVNHARATHGLKPLQESARLYAVAHAWADQMAAHRDLEHNPNAMFGSKAMKHTCPHATTAGENVGEQGTSNAAQLFALYKSSPSHWANIISPHYTDVGIATVALPNGDGTSSEWDVMDFANRCG